ncbi:MAG: NUDIX domain-containing protein [Chlamydiota bacterium]
MKIIHGSRIGAGSRIALCTNAVVFDAERRRVLLTRRSDNGRWCLPGGHVDPGETVAESCIREILEETGLRVRMKRLIGVYSSPDRVVEYADGNRYQIVALCFEAEVEDGTLSTSSETTASGFFAPGEIEGMDLMEHHRERIADALAANPVAFTR